MNISYRKDVSRHAAGIARFSNRVRSDSHGHAAIRADAVRPWRPRLAGWPMWRGSGLSVVAAALMIGLISFAERGREAAFAEETLYNGIKLPSPWPPQLGHFTREPMPVPYLETPPKVIPIDVGRQLFVDDFLVEHTTLKRTFHKARLHPDSPLLKPDKPWEAKQRDQKDPPHAMPFSDGVWYDPQEQLFRMWYMAGFCQSTCYASSKDGIHWNKPSLDVVPGTNIVHPGTRDSATVWLDHEETEPQRRYKMMRRDNNTRKHALHFSADGIHWTPEVGCIAFKCDRSTFFYNPMRKRWVFSVRSSSRIRDQDAPVRTRHYLETKDFLDAARPCPPDQAGKTDAATKAAESVPTIWVAADRLDPPRADTTVETQLYNLDAVAYESVLVGLFSIWRGRDPEYPRRDKINELCLGFSRDGFHWDRPDREPFVGVSEDPLAWNYSNIQSAGGGCLIVGDTLYFYVSGRNIRDIRTCKGKDRDTAYCSTGLVTLRRDGFASMGADATEGTLTTRSVRFGGKYLFVNVEAPEGELRAEVLDQDGKVIPPFSRDNCKPMRGDSTCQVAKWTNGGDLSKLAGIPVRFRFHLTQGKLYAFWVSPDRSGASHGYVAAGGPGFTGPTDTVGAVTSQEDSAP